MPHEEEGGGGPSAETAHHTTNRTGHHHVTGFSYHIAPCRQWGRGADAWRDGFRRGAQDALRLAAREIDDSHAWSVLSRLAARYTAPDDYELAGGGS
jgi:hypothetical protein